MKRGDNRGTLPTPNVYTTAIPLQSLTALDKIITINFKKSLFSMLLATVPEMLKINLLK